MICHQKRIFALSTPPNRTLAIAPLPAYYIPDTATSLPVMAAMRIVETFLVYFVSNGRDYLWGQSMGLQLKLSRSMDTQLAAWGGGIRQESLPQEQLMIRKKWKSPDLRMLTTQSSEVDFHFYNILRALQCSDNMDIYFWPLPSPALPSPWPAAESWLSSVLLASAAKLPL